MAHHAYFVTGEREQALAQAHAFVESQYGSEGTTLDVRELSFELFSIEDARRLISVAGTSGTGGTKVLIASMSRVFHEAQNALLKILEEPPAGVVIILCLPSEGVLIPTLRSRLLAVPESKSHEELTGAKGIASRFLDASASEREKIAAKLVEQSKADKDETKQVARREAIELIQGLTESAHQQLQAAKLPATQKELRLLLEDLASFTPILYERSAPLKLMFEHLLLVLPSGLGKSKV